MTVVRLYSTRKLTRSVFDFCHSYAIHAAKGSVGPSDSDKMCKSRATDIPKLVFGPFSDVPHCMLYKSLLFSLTSLNSPVLISYFKPTI